MNVVLGRTPDIFDSNSRRLLKHALSTLEGHNQDYVALGSRDFDAPTTQERAAVLERSRAEVAYERTRRRVAATGISVWDEIADASF